MGLLNSFNLEDLIYAKHSTLCRKAAQELSYYLCSSSQSRICALIVQKVEMLLTSEVSVVSL